MAVSKDFQKTETFFKRIKDGVVYLESPTDDAVFKAGNKKIFVKWPGGEEVEIDTDSNLLMDAILQPIYITQEKYESV